MVLSETQRKQRRAKESERDLGRWLLTHNGPDPNFQFIATTTGRVGHITDLQFDVISSNYAGENKNVKLPNKILVWWDQICLIAAKHKKQPLLRIVPSNEGKHPEMHIITRERHQQLLEKEMLLDRVEEMC